MLETEKKFGPANDRFDRYQPLNVAIFGFSAKTGASSRFSGLTYKCKFVQLFEADILLLMHEPPRADRLAVTRRRRRDF